MSKLRIVFGVALLAILLAGAILSTTKARNQSPESVQIAHTTQRAPAAQIQSRKSGKAPAPNSLEDLQQNSLRPWQLRSERGGAVVRLSAGAIVVDGSGIQARARHFLDRYASSLLGVSPGALREVERGARMIRYRQAEDGITVLNSKVSVFFDESGAVVHVVSETQPGRVTAGDAALSVANADSLARAALGKYVRDSGGDPAVYEGGTLRNQLFLFGESGVLRRMYRYVVLLEQPLQGEYEILIDAELGQVFSARNLARS